MHMDGYPARGGEREGGGEGEAAAAELARRSRRWRVGAAGLVAGTAVLVAWGGSALDDGTYEGLGVEVAALGVLGAGLVAVALGAALFDSINKKPDVAQSGAAEFVQKRNGEIRKVIILALGTRGDVEPCLALAAAAPRGVSALVCGPGDFAPLAKLYGVMFRSCGVDRLEPTRAWAEAKTMRDFILHAAKPYSTKFAPIASAYWQACLEHESEMIIASTFAVHFGVHMAEALACPFWALKFAPETPSGQMPPFGEASWTRWPWNTSIVTKGRHWARLLAAFQATQAVDFSGKQNKFRKEVLGLTDMTLEILDRLGSKLKTLYAYSSIVAPRPTDWPACHYVVGFFMSDVSVTLAAEFEALQDFARSAAAPPVCVCFGSMHAAADTDLVRSCISSTLQIGRTCVVIAPRCDHADITRGLDASASSQVFLLESVPHDLLFPLCACVVHHGGAGTTARSLKHGRPSLLIPALQFYDQVGWAKALDVGGAGIHLQAKHADKISIQEALSRLLDPANGFEGKADAMRRDISQEDALERAWSLLRASS